MSDLTCTWVIEPKKKDDGTVVPAHPCGQVAAATYSRLNPQRRHPEEPRLIVHPRCLKHDTPAAQKAAPEQGYERTEL